MYHAQKFPGTLQVSTQVSSIRFKNIHKPHYTEYLFRSLRRHGPIKSLVSHDSAFVTEKVFTEIYVIHPLVYCPMHDVCNHNDSPS